MNTLAKTSNQEILEAARQIIKPSVKTVFVTATAEIIQAAKPECRFCPIALSVNRVLRPSYYALMTGSLWIIPRGRKSEAYHYNDEKLLTSLNTIMKKYDAGVLIQPFQFELTLPAEFLL